MTPSQALSRRFRFGEQEFASSALYQRLSGIVADDPELLDIAAHCRAGQQPTNLLFAAVHYRLLGEPATGQRSGLADWYPSLGGTRHPQDPALVAAFTDFCRAGRRELVDLVGRRLVQTNVVKRSAVLRVGLAALAPMLSGRPVTFLEVGASSGIHLAFDRYRCRIGDTTLGPAGSPVLIESEWRSTLPVPTAAPTIADRLGVDLNPVDLTDPDERRWLQALVWPENGAQTVLLDAACRLVAAAPTRIVAGDAVQVLARLDAELSTDRPLVVWHAATRAHVPADRVTAFDAAITALARRRPLWTLSLETPDDADEWHASQGFCYALQLREGAGAQRRLAAVHGHGEWIVPLDWPAAGDPQAAR